MFFLIGFIYIPLLSSSFIQFSKSSKNEKPRNRALKFCPRTRLSKCHRENIQTRIRCDQRLEYAKQYVKKPKELFFWRNGKLHYVISTVRHVGGHVMIWGAMTANGVGSFCFIEGIIKKFSYLGILKEHIPENKNYNTQQPLP